MCAVQLFLSVDPSLGRVDYNLLSDQTLMEMLIDGFDDETQEKYKDNDGMYLDVCKWSHVICDDNERIIHIDIVRVNLMGSLELFYVPPKVKSFIISSCGSSKLTGSVALTQLPDGMTYLSLENSQLTGGIDLAHLPEGMKYLHLNNNQLTGEIELTRLPDGMEWLYLNNNRFTGEIDLTRLPGGMKCLYLNKNQFSGSLVIKELPQEMNVIDVRRNQFNAIAVVYSKTDTDIDLLRSGVTSVVDENGEEQDMQRFLC